MRAPLGRAPIGRALDGRAPLARVRPGLVASVILLLAGAAGLDAAAPGADARGADARGADARGADDATVKPVVGVKIYEAPAALSALFDAWGEIGINSAFASADVLRSGGFRELARERGITVFLIFPTFYSPEALDAEPELYAITSEGGRAEQEWVRFVCPSREGYRRRKVEEARRLVRELDPDGLSIDFVRHFVFWEKVYPDRDLLSIPNSCFDEHCMRRFAERTGVEIPNGLVTPQQRAEWVTGRHLNAWVGWKCELISEMVKDLAAAGRAEKPDLQVAAHILPWRRGDFGGALRIVAGQDPSQIGEHVDLLSPMCYAHMVKQPAEWVALVVDDLAAQSGAKILPSIQVSRAYREEALSAADFAASLEAALDPPSVGVVFWSWPALERDDEKRAIVAAAAARVEQRE